MHLPMTMHFALIMYLLDANYAIGSMKDDVLTFVFFLKAERSKMSGSETVGYFGCLEQL